ncbi:MAG: hypothetical protein CL583_12460 [Alteromonadaceae bacterium]|nr:hypothetical protein [Alteromonadaceae bacterium]|tara:strand:- start:2453 stop:3409 length:957 start_codon:yes stop_codon:yes gene_type:complete
MASKDKSSSSKIRKKINKELEKTSAQIETLISEALRQIDGLQTQIQQPVKKLIADLEKIREREMKRFHDEFERRMTELHDTQDMLLKRLGIKGKSLDQAKKELVKKGSRTADKAPKKAKKKAESVKASTEKKASKAAKSARKVATDQPAGTSRASTAKAPASSTASRATATTSGRKTAAAKSTGTTSSTAPSRSASARTSVAQSGSASSSGSPRKSGTAAPASSSGAKSQTTATRSTSAAAKPRSSGSGRSASSELGQIKGIGPAIERKLEAGGITRIDQIANPSATEQETLSKVASAKNLENWQQQARTMASTAKSS